MIALVALLFPNRQCILVLDSLYSGKSVLSKLSINFELIGPVPPKAALYRPAPEETERRSGPRGKNGDRLPGTKSWKKDSSKCSRIISTNTGCKARCKRKLQPDCIAKRTIMADCVLCSRVIPSVIGQRESFTARMSV